MAESFPQPGDSVPGAPPALLGAPVRADPFGDRRAAGMRLGTRSLLGAALGLLAAELIHRLTRQGGRDSAQR